MTNIIKIGQINSKHNLEETFVVMEHIYFIDDLKNMVINGMIYVDLLK